MARTVVNSNKNRPYIEFLKQTENNQCLDSEYYRKQLNKELEYELSSKITSPSFIQIPKLRRIIYIEKQHHKNSKESAEPSKHKQ